MHLRLSSTWIKALTSRRCDSSTTSSAILQGRTLHQVYSHFGGYLETQANRAAHSWGRGPSATADRIAAFFGTGQERAAKLDELHVGSCTCLEIEEECSKLAKYALPRESAQTQIQAFKCIVATVTRYHAATSLFGKYIPTIFGNISPGCLGCIGAESNGLSVVERLLVSSEHSVNSTSDAVAQWYLTGVLELPAFWQESGPARPRRRKYSQRFSTTSFAC
ncbi:hypothetical protein B0H14DRAFT_2860035 [Mycena olivaceomarginata]|nr:hypothetical protein B0H14DRAFT_2860035 [Mycena olivaceomarginata]